MGSDQGRVAGKRTQTFELDGKTYTLRTATVEMFAAMSAYCYAQKGDPIRAACDRLGSVPPEYREQLLRLALESAARTTATDEELIAFESSNMGNAFKLWWALKTDHADEFPTPESVYQLILRLSVEHRSGKLTEALTKLHIANGEEDLKNSVGQPATTA